MLPRSVSLFRSPVKRMDEGKERLGLEEGWVVMYGCDSNSMRRTVCEEAGRMTKNPRKTMEHQFLWLATRAGIEH